MAGTVQSVILSTVVYRLTSLEGTASILGRRCILLSGRGGDILLSNAQPIVVWLNYLLRDGSNIIACAMRIALSILVLSHQSRRQPSSHVSEPN